MEKGCENCRHKKKSAFEFPCMRCIRNATDKWEPEQTEIAVRRFDDLGRIVIPKAVRQRAFGNAVTEGKAMRIFCETDGTVILKPYDIDGL